MSKGAPMKAMSYLTSSVAKQGEYWMRPKVLMPEKTESAWAGVSKASRCVVKSPLLTDLSTAITWNGVVPQRLVRALQRLLVMSMALMSCDARRKGSNGSKDSQHDEQTNGVTVEPLRCKRPTRKDFVALLASHRNA